MVLTDRRLAVRSLVAVVEAAVVGGAGWVVLRERDLPYAERRAVADQLRALVAPGRLIVSGPDPLGGDAVHLANADPLPAAPVGLVGRSCHRPSELARLTTEAYVTLSPIFSTRTKPGYGPPLTPHGASRLAAGLAEAAPGREGVPGLAGESVPARPWLALGGVDSAERAERCAAAGAAGIAVMGAVMRADDPERLVRKLVTAFAAGAAE